MTSKPNEGVPMFNVDFDGIEREGDCGQFGPFDLYPDDDGFGPLDSDEIGDRESDHVWADLQRSESDVAPEPRERDTLESHGI